MIGSGMSGVLSRGPVRRLGSDPALFWRGVFITLFQIPLIVALFPHAPSWRGMGLALVFGAVGYLPIYFFFRGIDRGRVGVVAPIANTSAVITAMLAVFVLGEPFGAFRVAGLLVTVAGVALLSIDFRDWKRSSLFHAGSGIPFAIAACLGWGVVLFLIRYPVLAIGPILTSFIVELTILSVAGARAHFRHEPLRLPKDIRRTAVLIGFFGVLGTVAYDFGMATSAVAVVAILNMTNPVIAVAYERIVFKEKLSFRQIAGMVLAIAGAALVAAI